MRSRSSPIRHREFVIGAFNDEMGMQAVDPVLAKAASDQRAVSLSGMVFDGSKDVIQQPLAKTESDDPDNIQADEALPSGQRAHEAGRMHQLPHPGPENRARPPRVADVETGIRNEMPTALVDCMEFYLLKYFKPKHRRAGAVQRPD